LFATPIDELGSPAFVDVAKTMKTGTCPGNGIEKVLATSTLLGLCAVQNAPWRTMSNNDVGVFDGTVMASARLNWKPHSPSEGVNGLA
jgi:hypothetical protein